MSVFFTEEQVGELRVLRKAMRCCVRCAMRYACLRDAAPYQLSEEELEAAVASPESEEALATQEEAAAVDEAPAAICPLCLGCLQQCVQPAAIEAVANVVRSSGFEARDFALAVSVPVQLLLRERGGWLHLQRARAASTAASGGGFSLIGPTHGRGGGSAVGGTRAPSAAVGHPRYDKIVDIKEAMRWAMAPALSRALGLRCEGASAFLVHVSLSHHNTATEHHDILSKLVPPEPAHAKHKRQRQQQPIEHDSVRTVTRALQMERADNLISASRLCPPPPPTSPCVVAVAVERSNITLTGRYKKFSRQLPQSPWILDGARKAQGSVQECITEYISPLFGASEARFHSAGREDVDVRMLGNGRPFTLELVSPKRPFHDEAALSQAVASINAGGLVEINELRLCDLSTMSELMKEGEEAHRKEYRCCVALSRPLTPADVALLNESVDLVVQQLTPMRVLHRRTLMVRERTIHSMHAEQLSSRFLMLDLTTQAGTYVKEFVHGDFGRTLPSIGSLLGCEADILQLDVMGLLEQQ